jgi:hypothetical protein
MQIGDRLDLASLIRRLTNRGSEVRLPASLPRVPEHLPSLIPCNSALSTTQLNGMRSTVTVFLPTPSLNIHRLESVCGVAPCHLN